MPSSIEYSYLRAFLRLGHTVKCFDTTHKNLFIKIIKKKLDNRIIFSEIKNFNPDLIFVIKGYEVLPETIDKIRDISRARIFCFNSDDPFEITIKGTSNSNILDSIPFYDHYFTWSKVLLNILKQKGGARNVGYLPFGFDSFFHYPQTLSKHEADKYFSEITFVGSWDEEREKWLKELSSFNLGIWGNSDWLFKCSDRWLRGRWKKKEMFAQDMSKVVGSSHVSLNILRLQNKGSHNMRTFEAHASQAFVISERSPEICELFKEDSEAVYFSDPKEMKDKVAYYLKADFLRKKIAFSGYKRCLKSSYSYLDRAKQVLKTYEELK